MAGGESTGRSLALTPTWAIAAVCTALVVVSFLAERIIHRLSLWLKKTKQKAWREALERMKEELMLLGFISLAMTVSQYYITTICLPSRIFTRWTPCAPDDAGSGAVCQVIKTKSAPPGHEKRKLLELGLSQGRALAAEVSDQGSDPCRGVCKEGHQPLISQEGLHQLHIFVFIMACVHILYSALTMFLSLLKIRSWKQWEEEAQSKNHDSLTEITKSLTMKRQSTFVQYHSSKPWSKMRLVVWIICFFRQFFTSVSRADYLALRLGFLTNHNLDKSFNFYSYMVRTMEEEFKEIVGISAYLWAFVVCFLLFNVHGSDFYFWISFIPPILLLAIGTKLQHVIATLALENAKVQGPYHARQVRPRDELFWFKRPELLLGLIHFILFQNAFELATFFWFWWQFSLSSCFLENKAFNIVRLSLGFLVQIMASYSTLPLYALVSQMGSHYKLGKDVKGALHGWRNRVKGKLGVLHEDNSSSGDHGSLLLQPTSRYGGNQGAVHEDGKSSLVEVGIDVTDQREPVVRTSLYVPSNAS